MTEETSPEIAAIAAKGLAQPQSLTMEEIRRVCASALTQRDPVAGAGTATVDPPIKSPA